MNEGPIFCECNDWDCRRVIPNMNPVTYESLHKTGYVLNKDCPGVKTDVSKGDSVIDMGDFLYVTPSIKRKPGARVFNLLLVDDTGRQLKTWNLVFDPEDKTSDPYNMASEAARKGLVAEIGLETVPKKPNV